ncbi:dicarboxylate/amino acid:cation symporter [Ferruginibacter lapsinanis]|uniref:dicarboxylate/amino acid:cation symporter n=1 Tax=Ferruginibacter lapsinanis TaxID=563172 RepID=UPI001E396439|nr:dicarboxylate/amino acid:cation symporter [Ferruginibacter lapsinanis]UEG48546.1 dicarboxylate/amino acid:cation symporter [Ferruginibacter lapsinanis]
MEIIKPTDSKPNRLTLYIVIAMVLGIVAGYIIHEKASPEFVKDFAPKIKLLATIFLRLVQMIIAPLVFATLVVGIAKLGDLKTVGRVGGKAMIWFISASLISLLLGLVLVTITKPGVGVNLANADLEGAKDLMGKTKEFSLDKFVEHVVPRSVIEAMANNEILQLVIFSVFFGVALTAIGKKGDAIINALDSLTHVVLKMVGYVMNLAPVGVFGAMTGVIAIKGLGILKTYAYYIGSFYLGLAVLWGVLLFVGWLILRRRLIVLMRRISDPMAIAFNTASSEAVFPKLVEEMERFGCNNKIVSFTLPLGYSFNLDGSMMYMTFASMFIAQAYNVTAVTEHVGTQIAMLLVFMLTSKGIAGVPRASLVVVLATGGMFGIPPEGIGLVLAIDTFCDMGRSMTNVLGNALATAAVSKWEGALEHS